VGGSALYAASGSIYQYSVGGTGGLAAMSTASVAAGTTPSRFAVRPLGPAATDMRAVPATASATSLTWKVSFNRPVTGVEPSDFSLGASAGSWSVTGVTGSGAGPYTVTVTGGDPGVVNLQLVANAVTGSLGTTGPSAARTGTGGVMGGTPEPTVSSVVRVGWATTATSGDWVGEGHTLAYQWQVSDDGSTGWGAATGAGNATATYTPAVGDAWKYLRVRVTATAVDGSTATQVSAARAVQSAEVLYATNNGGANVSRFTVGRDGSLSTATNTAASTSPMGIATVASGRYVYVANNGANTISQYSTDEAGVLTPLASPTTVGGTMGRSPRWAESASRPVSAT
jgi:hypothetical protein